MKKPGADHEHSSDARLNPPLASDAVHYPHQASSTYQKLAGFRENKSPGTPQGTFDQAAGVPRLGLLAVLVLRGLCQTPRQPNQQHRQQDACPSHWSQLLKPPAIVSTHVALPKEVNCNPVELSVPFLPNCQTPTADACHVEVCGDQSERNYRDNEQRTCTR